MRNQIRVFAILLAVLLFVSGCVQSPPSTSSMTGNGDTSVPTVGTTDAPAVNIDLTADWKTPDVETAACAAFSDEGYYYFNDGYLHFLDTQNGISVILHHPVQHSVTMRHGLQWRLSTDFTRHFHSNKNL